MLEDLPQIVPQEVCLKCEGCCSFESSTTVWRPKILTEESYPQDSLDGDRYLKTVYAGNQWRCIHSCLETHKCKVYQSHPAECRLYPFLFVKRENRVVVSVHLSCPFILDVYNDSQFEGFVNRVKEYFYRLIKEKRIVIDEFIGADYSAYDNEIKDLFELVDSDE